MKYKRLQLIGLYILLLSLASCTFSGGTRPSITEPPPVASAPPVIPASSAWIDLQSVQNARQLGGYPVEDQRVIKPNMILRTGELARLTSADKAMLTEEYDLAYIIDLRDEIEVVQAPDPAMEGVQYRNFIVWPREVRTRILQESTTGQGLDAELYIQNYYTAFALEPAATEAYRKMFEVLLENETGSVLIHCVHGKDRTGIAAALILSALDVEWDGIEQDYMLSNTVYAGSVELSSLRFYRSVIEKHYGSLEKYLEVEMALDENDLLVLKERYTIPAK